LFFMPAAVILAAAAAGCGSSAPVDLTPTAEDRFAAAKAIFDKGDYSDAIAAFRTITLQDAGTAVADDAQYLLAESHFRRGEYLLASYEFGELRRLMSASPLVPDAQYRLAECYFMLSPRSNLDQQYTRKATEELQSAVESYPNHPSAARSSEMIRELTNRLARKSYDTAVLYARMEQWKASLFYYDDVIEKYHDTDYGPQAYLGKAELLMTRSRYSEALATVNRFIEVQPNSVMRGQADRLKATIEGELEKVLGRKPEAALPGTGDASAAVRP
jgi:outer membrane protein assembly factor BamD